MASIRIFRKSNLSVANILLISVSLIIVAFIVIVKLVNDHNYKVLRSSIDTLSKSSSTISLLYNTNQELSISENKFRIFLNTGDSNYRKQFLTHIQHSISYLEAVQHSEDSLDVSNVLSGFNKNIQLSESISRLKRMADSVSNKLYNVTSNSIYNNPIALKKINSNILRQYFSDKTDTLKAIKEKKGFFKKLGSLFSDKDDVKFQLVRGNGSTVKNPDSTSKSTDNAFDNVSDKIQRFYQLSLDKELHARQKLNSAEVSFAQTNLSIIDNLNEAIQTLLQKKGLQKQRADNTALQNAIQTRNSIQTLSWALSLIILAIVIISVLNIRKVLELRRKETMEVLTQKLSMERRLLQSQMDPHFVFNALGNIQSIILKNEKQSAIDYLSRFSKLMRQILVHSKKESISLGDEIDTLKHYIELQKLRLNFSFDYTIESSDWMNEHINIPPMLIQPFIENAIEHGLKPLPASKKGLLFISFVLNEPKECLVCSITDNGIGIEKSKEIKKSINTQHQSMAISITKERMQQMLKENELAGFTIKEIKDNDGMPAGTCATISIPYFKD
jgi:hypothetical protein